LIVRGSCDSSQIQSVLRDSSDSAATPAGLLVAEIEASGPGISETVLARCGVTRGVRIAKIMPIEAFSALMSPSESEFPAR